jgi:hypothetical protein
MPPEISYAYVWVDGQIRVDGAVECGRRFEGIAWIHSPLSANPCLRLDNPLGIGAIQVILDRLKEGFTAPEPEDLNPIDDEPHDWNWDDPSGAWISF